jgi:hypothetical protein
VLGAAALPEPRCQALTDPGQPVGRHLRGAEEGAAVGLGRLGGALPLQQQLLLRAWEAAERAEHWQGQPRQHGGSAAGVAGAALGRQTRRQLPLPELQSATGSNRSLRMRSAAQRLASCSTMPPGASALTLASC